MQRLPAADRRATPWKNGGGVTREVAAFPPGSSLDDFHWRASMAEVRADGPFSAFPQVDRILAVLEGRLRLHVAGLDPFDLAPGAAPARFPGDAPAWAEVLGGPVLDLNLMSRRGVARARLDRVDVCPAHGLEPLAGTRLVLALDGPLRVLGAEVSVELDRYDAVLAEPADGPLRLKAARPTFVYVASFEAV